MSIKSTEYTSRCSSAETKSHQCRLELKEGFDCLPSEFWILFLLLMQTWVVLRMSDNSNAICFEMVSLIRRRKLDRFGSWQQIHRGFPTWWRGFIFPVSERTEVSSPDWCSHVSFDRPSSTRLHTITRSRPPHRPARVSMSPKHTTGWEMYPSFDKKFQMS